MIFDYINQTYGVSARKGGRVEYTGNKTPQLGTIVGVDGPHLLIKLDGDKISRPYHPDWELRYLDAEASL
jgi:hypothetical protein